MSQYVDGFLLPLPKDKVDAYKSLATKAGEVWIEHGALAYWETLEDDLKTEGASFRTIANATENELVVFAWVVYPSKADRDRILGAVMEDPRLQDDTEMPFDMKRMAHGGFKPLVVFHKN
ncbi:MAG: DUF1428 domain-containing protein [Cellvibrio sp.]